MEAVACTPMRVVSSRRTRSQVAPDWTVEEMLVLVGEIAAIESDFMKALSSYQKWKIIADNCAALGVVRPLNQCRNKWKTILVEYKRIKDWETRSTIDSYWSLESDRKVEFGLPRFFDRELFKSIELHVKRQEDLSATDTDSDLDLNAIMDSGPRKKKRLLSTQKSKMTEREQEIAAKLQENVELIHSIVRGDMMKGKDIGCDDLGYTGTYWTQLRWQGSELIKVLGSLAGTLDQLSALLEENRDQPSEEFNKVGKSMGKMELNHPNYDASSLLAIGDHLRAFSASQVTEYGWEAQPENWIFRTARDPVILNLCNHCPRRGEVQQN